MAKIIAMLIAATSRFAGFKNYRPNATGSVAIPSLSLSAGQYSKYTFSMPVGRSNAITTFRVRLTGVDSYWRQVRGYIQVDKPNLSAWEYSVQIQGYYTGNNFVCDIYVINQAGSPIVTPAMTINGELNLFVAPF